MKPKIDYTLYLVTDQKLMSPLTIELSTTLAITGGCTVVQLREKDISSKEFYETATRVRKLTEKYGVPLIINDRVDIAVSVNADGVHVGKSDLPIKQVRRILGEDKIIGASVSDLDEATEAIKQGADYLGVGPMYPTNTKCCYDFTSLAELKKIRQQTDLPIVVIGGINKNTIPDFKDVGIDGIAVVSAIVCEADVANATRELKTLFTG